MKLIIIDDHPLVRKGLQFVLSMEEDIEVIGEASSISETLSLLQKQEPDIVLVDLRLGAECGLDILEKCKQLTCKFIILTSSSDEYDFKRAVEAGAYGFVLKDSLPEELIYAIRLVSHGRKYYDPGIIKKVMKSSTEQPALVLTLREKEVLMALGQGLSNRNIANKLFITEYTVKKHVSQILTKLGLTDRTQAALYSHSIDFKHAS